MVRLQLCHEILPQTREKTFNPTMVRLQRNTTSTSAASAFSFNPTMVRLQRTNITIVPARCPCFQSHYGAIATGELFPILVTDGDFQSHYGAIATTTLLSLSVSMRLLSIPLWCDCNPSRIIISPPRSEYFQSHYGAIATCWCDYYIMIGFAFQSHYGAIATRVLAKRMGLEPSFNPTMVRLQLSSPSP